MDASKESVTRMGKQEEQQVSPAAKPAATGAAVTSNPAGIKQQDKATSVATPFAATSAHHAPPPPPPSPASALVASGGRVAEEEMENAGGSSSGGAAVERSPLAAAVSALSDQVLERMMKVLMRKCNPPQDAFPLTGKSPVMPPWWPKGNEGWWPELGAGAVAPPYRPARVLSKVEKEVAVVAMVKNIAPDFEHLAMAIQMASTVTSVMTDAEAAAWDAGVAAEHDAYVAVGAAPVTRAGSLLRSIKPEAVRMKKRKEPTPAKKKTPPVADTRTVVLALPAPSAPLARRPVGIPAHRLRHFTTAPAAAATAARGAPARSGGRASIPAVVEVEAAVREMANLKAPGAP
uniref:Ethylene insensitive 3-like DNA-binding domain-containing protein n=1 Tax=Leersia perrieri TaxID=77586 RepID=A0A0D9WXK3_9ORYZ